jgi:hypothetical protein
MEQDGRVMFLIEGWMDFISSLHLKTIGQALLLTTRPTTRMKLNVVFVIDFINNY